MWLQWLDECLRLHSEAAQQQDKQQEQQQQASEEAEQQQQQQQQQQDGSALPPAQQAECVVFAPVVGGASEVERERSAKAAAEREVAGERLLHPTQLCGVNIGLHVVLMHASILPRRTEQIVLLQGVCLPSYGLLLPGRSSITTSSCDRYGCV
jgi:hypothetical protein